MPEDVDFVMEHLNDPNYNLEQTPSSPTLTNGDSFELASKKDITESMDYKIPHADTESQADSASYYRSSSTYAPSTSDYDE